MLCNWPLPLILGEKVKVKEKKYSFWGFFLFFYIKLIKMFPDFFYSWYLFILLYYILLEARNNAAIPDQKNIVQ